MEHLKELSGLVVDHKKDSSENCTWGHVAQLAYMNRRLSHLTRYVAAGVVEGVEYEGNGEMK